MQVDWFRCLETGSFFCIIYRVIFNIPVDGTTKQRLVTRASRVAEEDDMENIECVGCSIAFANDLS
jgi:hypothetical protein